jgi:hypothetical protein
MAANTVPITPITQIVGKVALTAADTSYTAPTTAGAIAFTAGTNGARIDCMKIRALGTNSSATVLRIFVNDGGGVAVANFSLVYEQALPISTLSQTAVASADILLFAENFDNMGGSTSSGNGVLPPYLPAGYKLYVSIGTAAAAGWQCTTFGGNY